MQNKIKRALSRAAGATLLATAVLAPATASAQISDEWKYSAIIYGYFPDIGGKTRFPPREGGSNVDVNIDSILDALKFAFMGTLQVQKGRWGGFFDIIYLDVGGSKSNTRDVIYPGGLPAGVTTNLSLDLKGSISTIAGTYRVYAENGSVVDVLGGARVLSIKPTLNYEFVGDLAGLVEREGKSEKKVTNWDGIIGVKGRATFGANRDWFVPYYFDVGTGDSKNTWQAIGGIGYSFKWGEVIGAWRYIDYNLKSGEALEDINFNGPAIGLAFHW